MDIPRILFSDLKTGGSSSVVETRLLRFWEVKSPIRGGELMRVDMILIDADVNFPLQFDLTFIKLFFKFILIT